LQSHYETILVEQSLMTKSIASRKNRAMMDDDQKHQKRMADVFERSNRFSALDRLSYLKTRGIVHTFLSNSEGQAADNHREQPIARRRKKQCAGQPSLSSNDKQEYCERWLTEESPLRRTQVVETTDDDSEVKWKLFAELFL
jgi:hypothetical protein